MDEAPQEIINVNVNEALYLCSLCGNMLPASAFYPSKRIKRGFLYRCKECQKAKAKAAYRARRRGGVTSEQRIHFRPPADIDKRQMTRMAAELGAYREMRVQCNDCGDCFTCRLPESPRSSIFCPACIHKRVLAVLAERRR